MPDRPKGKIFINYRRGEDSAAAGRLYDRLEQQFGKSSLLMDVDDIAAGVKEIELLIRKLELDKEILADPTNGETNQAH